MTCYLFPVVMTSFNTAASQLLEPLINMHLVICHTLFKTSCHIIFHIKRFYLNRGCGTTAGWKTVLNINLLPGGKPQASCTTYSMTSWPEQELWNSTWLKNLPECQLAPRRKTPGQLYHTFNDFLACDSKHFQN